MKKIRIWIGIILVLIAILLFSYTYFFAPESYEDKNPSAPDGTYIVYNNTGMKGYIYVFSFVLCIVGFIFIILGLLKLKVSAET